MLKVFSKKIPAINEREEMFLNALNRTTDISTHRNLIGYFLNEDTSYPIADSFAKSASDWLEEEYVNFQKFEKTLDFVVEHVNSKDFENYCAQEDLRSKEYKSFCYLRNEKGWNSVYDTDSNSLKVVTDGSFLKQLSFVNRFNAEGDL